MLHIFSILFILLFVFVFIVSVYRPVVLAAAVLTIVVLVVASKRHRNGIDGFVLPWRITSRFHMLY